MTDGLGHSPDSNPATSPDAVKPTTPARRRVLAVFGVLTGGLAALAVGVPAVGYLFAPMLRRLRRQDAWVVLGSMAEFSRGSTRLVRFDNPVRQPWDGQSARMAAYVRCS